MKRLLMLLWLGMISTVSTVSVLYADSAKHNDIGPGNPIHIKCVVISKLFPDGSYTSLIGKKIVFDIDGKVVESVHSLDDDFTYVRTVKWNNGVLVDLYMNKGTNPNDKDRMLLLPRIKFEDEPVTAGLMYISSDDNKEGVYLKTGCLAK